MSGASTRSTPGSDELVKALRREGLPVQKLTNSPGARRRSPRSLNYVDLESLHAAIGEGHVSAKAVVQRVQKELRGGEEQLPVTVQRPPRARSRRNVTAGVHVEGLDDVMVRLSRCCTPVPGDEIMGFVTRGRGVSVHRTDCANAMSLRARPTACIEVEWDHDAPGTYVVGVEIEALDRSKLLRDVADVLSEHHVNILSCTTQTQPDRIARLRFEFELADPGPPGFDPRGGQAGRLRVRRGTRPARRPQLANAPVCAPTGERIGCRLDGHAMVSDNHR